MGTNDRTGSDKLAQQLHKPHGLASSPYNIPIAQGMPSRKLVIQDCTLREGEQSRDINFSVDEKVEIARLLANIGVPEIEYGSPGRSQVDFELSQKIRKQDIRIRLDALVHIYLEDWKEQIDRTVESCPDSMNLVYPASDIRLEKVVKVTRAQAVARCGDALDYAIKKAAGKDIAVGYLASDTTRTNWDHLEQVIKTALGHGAQRLGVADTTGCALPQAFKDLVGRVRMLVGDAVPIDIHCHNDYGLALANTLAGVEGGATILQCSINGVGERNGIAALAELAAALESLYGMQTGIKLSDLHKLSEAFAGMSHVATPFDRAVVGDYSFCHKLDSHVLGVLSLPEVYETICAETVGATRTFALGKYSGPFVVSHKAKQLGISVPQHRMGDIIGEIEMRSIQEKKAVSDELFREIVQKWA